MVGKIKGKAGKETYWLDGKEVSKEEFDAAFPPKPFAGMTETDHPFTSFPPLVSEALAVHPLDREEAVALAKTRDVPTDFTPNGMPIFTSKGHRDRYLKTHGFYDRDSGHRPTRAGKGFKVFRMS